MQFIKMHGLGNDFIIFDGRHNPITLDTALIKAISDRHKGIGCDQVVIIGPAKNNTHHAFMRFFNADGSESATCGNATRCVAALIMEETHTDKVNVATSARNYLCTRTGDGKISVTMGKPLLSWQDIPLAREVDTLHLPVIAGAFPEPVAVSMGNPHCVFFVPHIAKVDLEGLATVVKESKLFPEGCNVSAAEIRSPHAIHLRVWERGTGETLACGSGACATVVASRLRKLTEGQVAVTLPGGILEIGWQQDNEIIMRGLVAKSFAGTFDPRGYHHGA